MNHILARIKEKIAAQSLVVLPKVKHEEIIAFEKKFQITLPEDYKAFLSEIGAGFEHTRRFLTPKDWKESFWIKPQTINPFTHPCELLFDHEFHANWLELVNDPIKKSQWEDGKWDPMFGTIAIGEIGCGLYYRMILNGDLMNNIFIWGDHALNPPKFQEQVGYLNWIEFHIDTYTKPFNWIKQL